ncbi:MAG TPA: sigma-70 family RNA polymerase sigma factor [Polyangiaceae bacterium]|nr:sigma-70 family RNA polymerase sigma factor [Polyangiaceae bacterium]
MSCTLEGKTLFGAASGCKEDLRQLLEFVHGTVASVLGPHAPDVKDATQEAMLRVLRAVNNGRFSLDGGSAKAFVHVIAVRIAIDQRKKRSETWRPDSGPIGLSEIANPSDVDPVEMLQEHRQRSLVPRLLEGLDELDRAVVILSCDGLSTQEIAKELALVETTVRTKIHRVKKKLRSRAHGVLSTEKT